MPDIQFLNIKDVSKRTTLSTSTIRSLVREQAFPPPVSITPMRLAWVAAEVNEWQEAIVARRQVTS